jgi:hypothetical protein
MQCPGLSPRLTTSRAAHVPWRLRLVGTDAGRLPCHCVATHAQPIGRLQVLAAIVEMFGRIASRAIAVKASVVGASRVVCQPVGFEHFVGDLQGEAVVSFNQSLASAGRSADRLGRFDVEAQRGQCPDHESAASSSLSSGCSLLPVLVRIAGPSRPPPKFRGGLSLSL